MWKPCAKISRTDCRRSEPPAHADRMHFWPYGLNYDNESSPENDPRFVKMIAAFRKDMRLR